MDKEIGGNGITESINKNLEILSQDVTSFIQSYIKKDFGEFFILLILSCSFVGLPIMIGWIFMKSFSLGITISALIYVNGIGYGMSFSILVFLIPTLMKVLMLLFILGSSAKLLENLFHYQKEMKYEMIRHALNLLIAFFIVCILILYRIFSLHLVNQLLI